MSVVIDSSIFLAWVYSDETTEAVWEVFQRVGKAGAGSRGFGDWKWPTRLRWESDASGMTQIFARQVSPT